LSPVLSNVLTKPTNVSFKGIVIARLDRAALGDFDCFVLGNFLAALYPYTVIIPDFGFYQCDLHQRLLRQDRLWAGIQSFDQVPAFTQSLIVIKDKEGTLCTPHDAELLAVYEGLAKGTVGHRDFIEEKIGA
jgi:hypothetical protein